MKNALWSFHVHGNRRSHAMVPSEFLPIPLTRAMEAAADWGDAHAPQRRAQSLRRLHQPFLSGIQSGAEPEHMRGHFRGLDARRLCTDFGESFGVRDDVTERYVESVRAVAEAAHEHPCFPLVDIPTYDPKGGATSVFGKMIVFRPLDRHLASLLDPRGWDNCSDLFEDCHEVEERNGGYVEKHVPASDYGKDWGGLLYEFADAGPHAVENILRIKLTVTRICNELPGYERTDRCEAQECDDPILRVRAEYQLHDSLSWRAGALTLPGLMRRNEGYMEAYLEDNQTRVDCMKTVHYGRLTQWSGGVAYDYGEILNYMAPTYLSLWIGDVEQIVPCCKRPKPITDTAGGS